MTFREILQQFRDESETEKEKGTRFERLIKRWLGPVNNISNGLAGM